MRARLELFVKGNGDIIDAIYGARRAGGQEWGGLNAVFRARDRAVTARIRHETSAGFALLTGAAATLPPDVVARAGLFGTFAPSQQHSQALFDARAPAVVLSLQPDIGVPRWRHRESGLLFTLHGARDWPEEARAWRLAAFEPVAPSTPDETMGWLLDIVARLQHGREVAVIVANMTPLTPGEALHALLGMPETLSLRVRRFNLALEEAARQADFSILDVERIVAEGGAERLAHGPMHLTLEGCRRVAEEAARILDDRGVIAPC